jgi:hypothetical protein
MKKRCAGCVNVAPVARTVSRCGRNENTALATIPHTHKVPGIKNNLCRNNFQRSRVLKFSTLDLWKIVMAPYYSDLVQHDEKLWAVKLHTALKKIIIFDL